VTKAWKRTTRKWRMEKWEMKETRTKGILRSREEEKLEVGKMGGRKLS